LQLENKKVLKERYTKTFVVVNEIEHRIPRSPVLPERATTKILLELGTPKREECSKRRQRVW
jgi:hypothetical protein